MFAILRKVKCDTRSPGAPPTKKSKSFSRTKIRKEFRDTARQRYMRTFTFVCRIFLTVSILVLLSTAACAASILDGLPIEPRPMGGLENAFRKLSSVPENEVIRSFDASEETGILLVTSSHMTYEHHLWHMNAGGTPIAVYAFECAGDVGVAWDGADICVFFTRGGSIMKVDCSGTLKECWRLAKNNYETGKTWQTLAHRTEKSVSNGSYFLRTKGFELSSDATMLVFVERETGKEKLLYDVSEANTIKTWFLLIVAIAFVSFILIKIFGRKPQYLQDAEHNSSE